MLVGGFGNQVIIASGKEGFPSGNYEWRDFFQLVVIRFMGQIHAAGHKGEAAGGVKRGSGSSLHARGPERPSGAVWKMPSSAPHLK